jgi:hypothetical protein
VLSEEADLYRVQIGDHLCRIEINGEGVHCWVAISSRWEIE